MSEGLNRVMLIGNLGADPDIRFVGNSGECVMDLRLACTESYLDKNKERQERTEWVNVVVWGKRAEALGKLIRKGETIAIEGSLKTESYEKDGAKRYVTKVVAREVILLGGRKGGGADTGPGRGGEERTSRGESKGPAGGAARGNGRGWPGAGKPPHINDMGGPPPNDDIPW